MNQRIRRHDENAHDGSVRQAARASLSPPVVTFASVAWVAAIAVFYLLPAADRAWWAVPFQCLDALAGIPFQIAPGPETGARIASVLRDVVVTVIIVAGCVAAGDLLLRALRARPSGKAWRLCAAFAAGAWAVSTLVLVLGAFGILAAPVFLLVLTVCAVAAVVTLPHRPNRDVPRTSREPARRGWSFVRFLMVMALLAGVVQFVAALTPPIEYDSLEYHLGAPAHYLREGRIGFVAGNVYASFPALTEMLYLLGLVLDAEGAPKLVHFVFGLATAAAAGLWAGRHWGRTVGWSAAALFLAMPFTMLLAMTARIDLATAFLGFLAVAEALDARGEGRPAAVRAALFAGAAVCTKYTALLLVSLPVAVVLGLGYALAPGTGRGVRVRRGILWSCAVLAASVVLASPWLIKNAVLTGNPVYPLLSQWLGGRDWSPSLEALFRAKHLHPGLTAAVTEFARKIIVYNVIEPGAVPAFLMLLPLLALRRNESEFPGVRAACGASGLMLLVWGIGTYAPWRFAYPAAGMLCAVAATTAAGWADVRPARGAARAGLAFCLVWGLMLQTITVAADVHAPGRRPAVVSPLSYASGQVSRDEFVRPVAGPVFWMNDHLPDDAVVLYVGEARTYYARHRHVANTVYNHSAVGAWVEGAQDLEEIAARAREAGVTHVYLHAPEIERLRRNYGYLRDFDFEMFGAFLSRYGELVFGEPGRTAVYALHLADGDGT